MTRINLYSKLKLDPSYKLIQLTPDLLKVIEQSSNNDNSSDGGDGSATGLEFKTSDMNES